jgi:hypothetical protein
MTKRDKPCQGDGCGKVGHTFGLCLFRRLCRLGDGRLDLGADMQWDHSSLHTGCERVAYHIAQASITLALLGLSGVAVVNMASVTSGTLLGVVRPDVLSTAASVSVSFGNSTGVPSSVAVKQTNEQKPSSEVMASVRPSLDLHT